MHSLIKNNSLELIQLFLRYKADLSLENYQTESVMDTAVTYLLNLEAMQEEEQAKLELESLNAFTKDDENLSHEDLSSSEESEAEIADLFTLSQEIREHALIYEQIHQNACIELQGFIS